MISKRKWNVAWDWRKYKRALPSPRLSKKFPNPARVRARFFGTLFKRFVSSNTHFILSAIQKELARGHVNESSLVRVQRQVLAQLSDQKIPAEKQLAVLLKMARNLSRQLNGLKHHHLELRSAQAPLLRAEKIKLDDLQTYNNFIHEFNSELTPYLQVLGLFVHDLEKLQKPVTPSADFNT